MHPYPATQSSQVKTICVALQAYCTRVGEGPFPTELLDAVGEKLREKGGEYGTTTGRPRRCGWIDIPQLKYAIMVSTPQNSKIIDQLISLRAASVHRSTGSTA